MLAPLHSLLAQSSADPEWVKVVKSILEVIGAITIAVAIVVILGSLTMVKDLFRYLRIKSM